MEALEEARQYSIGILFLASMCLLLNVFLHFVYEGPIYSALVIAVPFWIVIIFILSTLKVIVFEIVKRKEKRGASIEARGTDSRKNT